MLISQDRKKSLNSPINEYKMYLKANKELCFKDFWNSNSCVIRKALVAAYHLTTQLKMSKCLQG